MKQGKGLILDGQTLAHIEVNDIVFLSILMQEIEYGMDVGPCQQ